MAVLSTLASSVALSAYLVALAVLGVRLWREWKTPTQVPSIGDDPFDSADRRRAAALVLLGYGYYALLFGAIYLNLVRLAGPEYDLAVYLRGWNHWDGGRYVQIASEGYVRTGPDAVNIVFPPLFSLGVAAVGTVVPIERAPLVFNFILIGPFVYLFFRLARLDFERPIATGATLLWIAAPLGYLRFAAYSETLFCVLLLAAMYRARIGQWGRSGGASFAMALTRSTGYFVWPALLFEYVAGTRARGLSFRSAGWRNAFVLAIPLSLVAYLAVNAWVHDDPFAFLSFQRATWKKQIAPFTEGIRTAVQLHGYADLKALLTQRNAEGFALAVAIGMTLWSAIRQRLTYGLFMATCLFFFASTSWILSTPRYVSVFFPIPLLLAGGIAHASERTGTPWLGRALLALLLTMNVAASITYGSWFVRAKWAF